MPRRPLPLLRLSALLPCPRIAGRVSLVNTAKSGAARSSRFTSRPQPLWQLGVRTCTASTVHAKAEPAVGGRAVQCRGGSPVKEGDGDMMIFPPGPTRLVARRHHGIQCVARVLRLGLLVLCNCVVPRYARPPGRSFTCCNPPPSLPVWSACCSFSEDAPTRTTGTAIHVARRLTRHAGLA